MAVTKLEDVAIIRNRHRDQKIVFCSGSFDVTHAGHVLFFEDCKMHGDILVVMVGCDAAIRSNKGNHRPILNQHVRLKMVDSLKPVDYCFIDEIIPGNNHVLWSIEMAMDKLKPDIYVINEDAGDIPYRKTIAQKTGVRLVILDRYCPPEFEKISTTKIIHKIKNEGPEKSPR